MINETIEIISIDEMCEMLNIGRNTAYRLLHENVVSAFRIGRTWKIPRQRVIDYIKSCNENSL